MKKQTYNTRHGQLAVETNGRITLRFNNLHLQLNSSQFHEFVSFLNNTPKEIKETSNFQIDRKNILYFEIIKNMNSTLIHELKNLVNTPIFFSLEKHYHIFDNLIIMPNNPNKIFIKDISKNITKVNKNSICQN